MARRQVSQLHTPAEEKGIGGDEEGVGSLPRKCCEDRINLSQPGVEPCRAEHIPAGLPTDTCDGDPHWRR
jgi:hypothetical protein